MMYKNRLKKGGRTKVRKLCCKENKKTTHIQTKKGRKRRKEGENADERIYEERGGIRNEDHVCVTRINRECIRRDERKEEKIRQSTGNTYGRMKRGKEKENKYENAKENE